jgi:hypothetical protein
MAQKIRPEGPIEALPAPVGGRYTADQVAQMVGGIGGQIQSLEYCWEGEDIVAFFFA